MGTPSAATINPSSNTVVLGFPSGATVTGLLRTATDLKTEANIEDIEDESGEVVAQVISKRKYIIVIDALVESTFTGFPAKGTSIACSVLPAVLPTAWANAWPGTTTGTAVKWMVQDCSVKASPTISRVSLTLELPVNVLYT